jgi:hypothetical protein
MSGEIVTIAKQYASMLESANLIDEIIASKETDEETLLAFDRNKNSLISMRAKTFWTDEDMTAIDAALGKELE